MKNIFLNYVDNNIELSSFSRVIPNTDIQISISGSNENIIIRNLKPNSEFQKELKDFENYVETINIENELPGLLTINFGGSTWNTESFNIIHFEAWSNFINILPDSIFLPNPNTFKLKRKQLKFISNYFQENEFDNLTTNFNSKQKLLSFKFPNNHITIEIDNILSIHVIFQNIDSDFIELNGIKNIIIDKLNFLKPYFLTFIY